MQSRVTLALLTVSCLFAAADKKLPVEQSSNELVEISASLLDRDQVQKELGSDLPGIVVVRMRVRPLSDKPVHVDRDDFFLLDTDDGERSTPYAPSQIAGNSTLVVTSQGTRGSLTGGNPNGPIWGGLGGGRPRQLPGNGGGIGSTGGEEKTNSTAVKSDDKPESPLLKALKLKVLPEKNITEPIEGLLFFQIEARKTKPKDFELYYKTPSGRLAMRFRP